MEITGKNIVLIAIVSLLINLVMFSVLQPNVTKLGGYTEGHWDSADGYKVDGTTVIDGDGNYDGAITGTSATLSSTLAVTGESNLDTLVFGGDSTYLGGWESATATAAQVCDSSILRIATAATTTFGLPTGTALIADCLPAIGDTKFVLLGNISTTTEDAFTITASTTGGASDSADTILLEPESGTAIIIESEWAWLKFTNFNGATTTVSLEIFQDAD